MLHINNAANINIPDNLNIMRQDALSSIRTNYSVNNIILHFENINMSDRFLGPQKEKNWSNTIRNYLIVISVNF